jgi:hypothetical protein
MEEKLGQVLQPFFLLTPQAVSKNKTRINKR